MATVTTDHSSNFVEIWWRFLVYPNLWYFLMAAIQNEFYKLLLLRGSFEYCIYNFAVACGCCLLRWRHCMQDHGHWPLTTRGNNQPVAKLKRWIVVDDGALLHTIPIKPSSYCHWPVLLQANCVKTRLVPLFTSSRSWGNQEYFSPEFFSSRCFIISGKPKKKFSSGCFIISGKPMQTSLFVIWELHFPPSCIFLQVLFPKSFLQVAF